jgi:hypothetical protein
MFQTVLPSIIRSSELHTHTVRYLSDRYCYLLLAGQASSSQQSLAQTSTHFRSEERDTFLTEYDVAWPPDSVLTSEQ